MKITELTPELARKLLRAEYRKAFRDCWHVSLAMEYRPVRYAKSLLIYAKTLDSFNQTWKDDNWMIEENKRLAQLELDYILSGEFWK